MIYHFFKFNSLIAIIFTEDQKNKEQISTTIILKYYDFMWTLELNSFSFY